MSTTTSTTAPIAPTQRQVPAPSAVAATTPLIRWLDDAAADPSLLGGKAASLSRLMSAGLPVPPGFVIAPAAFAHDPAATESSAALAGGAREAILRAYAALAERVGEAEPLVAVRSSATTEDLAEASFAGQYETVLGVATATWRGSLLALERSERWPAGAGPGHVARVLVARRGGVEGHLRRWRGDKPTRHVDSAVRA